MLVFTERFSLCLTAENLQSKNSSATCLQNKPVFTKNTVTCVCYLVTCVGCVQDTYRRRQVQRSVTRQMSFDLTKLMVTEDWFSDISPQTMRRLLNIVSVTGLSRHTTKTLLITVSAAFITQVTSAFKKLLIKFFTIRL